MTGSTEKNGLPQGDYYAPRFSVEIDGAELTAATIAEVIQLKVTMDINNMNSFDMTVANMRLDSWDGKPVDANNKNENAKSDKFKYSDSHIFDIGRQVHIKMGYGNKLISLFSGEISRMTPRFPETGNPSCTVSGSDGFYKLRHRKVKAGEVTKYVNKNDWEIAEKVAKRNGLKIAKIDQTELPKHAEVIQKNQDDAQFLMERAKRIDYDCFVSTDPNTAESILYFVKPKDGRGSETIKQFTLTWGRDLINFNPSINLSRQVSQLTVRGWSHQKKQAITYTATPTDIPGVDKKAKTGPRVAQETQQNKSEVVVDAPVTSEEEAIKLAKSLLAERAYEYIKATGQMIGQPELRPGDNLKIDGIGWRFNGNYYITRVEHTIGANGYRTQFHVRRLFEGDIK